MYLLNFRNRILRILLYPFTFLYLILVGCRNKLFDSNIFKTHKFPVPVISIGNITAGGTGKTPFTIYLAGMLKIHYKKIAIVSRGYHRRSKGLVVVSDGRGNIGSVEQCGDEAVLIAKKLPESVVIVSENRVKGVAKALDDFLCDIILLDDAFQHRRIYRDCDIVLINHKSPIYREYLLPTGNLREPQSQLKRADIIIFTNSENNLDNHVSKELNKYYSGPVFTCTNLPEYYLDPESNKKYSIQDLKGKSVTAFCGIAEPQLFKQLLINLDLKIKDMIIFPDHHSYTDDDVVKISNKTNELNCGFVITTEKDLVKINWPQGNNSKIVALALRMSIKNELYLLQKVKEYIDKR